jgi:AraC family transcriptional regulator
MVVSRSRFVELAAKNHASQIKPYLTTLSSSKAAWDGILVEHDVDSTLDVHEVTSPAHLIAVHYGQAASLEWTTNGRTQRSRFTPGVVNINPFGYSLKQQWHERAEFILLALDPQLFEHVAEESLQGSRAELILRFEVHDPLIEQIALTLMGEIAQDKFMNRLYAESLTNSLAFHLVRNYSVTPSDASSNTHVYSGGLTPRQLQRAIEYINSHLDQSISLVEIANAVEISSSHFARAFKRSTGIPPHKYLTQQRVEQAKTLLANSKLSLAEIAFHLGFSSQGHFTTVFRQWTEMTPNFYRKSL